MQNDSIDNVRLDINNEKVRACVYTRLGDTKTRTLHISLADRGTVVDLSNAVFVEVLIHKPDGNETDQGAVVVGNEIQYTLRTQDVNVEGESLCQVMITFSDESVLTSPTFSIMVFKKEIDDRAVQSMNEYTAIQQQAAASLNSANNAARSEQNTSMMEANVMQIQTDVIEREENILTIHSDVLELHDDIENIQTDIIERQENIEDIQIDVTAKATTAEECAKSSMDSETNCKISEINAKASETKAKEYEDNASQSAEKAHTSELNAKDSEDKAKASENNALTYKNESADSASSALGSEDRAKTSETNAKTSEEIVVAKATEITSAEYHAGEYAEQANQSATSAGTSADNAKKSEDNAFTSESNALISESNAEGYMRDAKTYAEQAKAISESFSGAMKPMGTVTFANLPSISVAAEGDMYNISDEFTTTSDFKEGAGKVFPEGTNVYKTADGFWDCLAGSPVVGVKGNAETSYRRGNVNITKENIGLGNVPNVTTNNQTPTFSAASTRSNIASGDTITTLFGKIAKWFSDLKTVAFTGAYSDLSGKPSIPSKVSDLTNDSGFTKVEMSRNLTSGTKVGTLTIDGTAFDLYAPAGYTLPKASASALGGIKVGTNLSIDANGVLSAKDTTYSVATTKANGLLSATDKAKIDSIGYPRG